MIGRVRAAFYDLLRNNDELRLLREWKRSFTANSKEVDTADDGCWRNRMLHLGSLKTAFLKRHQVYQTPRFKGEGVRDTRMGE